MFQVSQEAHVWCVYRRVQRPSCHRGAGFPYCCCTQTSGSGVGGTLPMWSPLSGPPCWPVWCPRYLRKGSLRDPTVSGCKLKGLPGSTKYDDCADCAGISEMFKHMQPNIHTASSWCSSLSTNHDRIAPQPTPICMHALLPSLFYLWWSCVVQSRVYCWVNYLNSSSIDASFIF